MDLRVLTWDVFGGRATPSPGRDLAAAFAAALAGWEWDVALLQRAPPWWLAGLRRSLRCEASGVLNSRTALLGVRRAIAVRRPDLMGPAGGGANLILARSDRIIDARAAQLCRWPQRRRVHGVELACGVWVANLHASAGPAAARDLREAIRICTVWSRAGRLPLILGGVADLPDAAAEPLRTAASAGADRVLCDAAIEIRPASVATPEHGTLSGRAPLAVTLVI